MGDLDDNGTISDREIQLLKAVLDAILHLGERPVTSISTGGVSPVEGTTAENGKTLALTIFDAVDRDGDGKLSLVEMVQFIQKVLTLVIGALRLTAHAYIECYMDEILKSLVAESHKKMIDKEEWMVLIMMALLTNH